jgi:hypothetical protein
VIANYSNYFKLLKAFTQSIERFPFFLK